MTRAIQIIDELTKAYVERGVGLHFAHLRTAQMKLFELVGIAELVSFREILIFTVVIGRT